MTRPAPRPPRGVPDQVRFTSTDPAAMLSALQALQEQNEYLALHIEHLQAQLPSDEELAFVRLKKREWENANWAWALIKRHAPWVITVCTVFGGLVAWLASTSITVSGKP